MPLAVRRSGISKKLKVTKIRIIPPKNSNQRLL